MKSLTRQQESLWGRFVGGRWSLLYSLWSCVCVACIKMSCQTIWDWFEGNVWEEETGLWSSSSPFFSPPCWASQCSRLARPSLSEGESKFKTLHHMYLQEMWGACPQSVSSLFSFIWYNLRGWTRKKKKRKKFWKRLHTAFVDFGSGGVWWHFSVIVIIMELQRERILLHLRREDNCSYLRKTWNCSIYFACIWTAIEGRSICGKLSQAWGERANTPHRNGRINPWPSCCEATMLAAAPENAFIW